MSDNGVPNAQPPEHAMGTPLHKELLIHDFHLGVTKVGDVTLIHLDAVPFERITLKVDSNEALDKFIGIIRGITIAGRMP